MTFSLSGYVLFSPRVGGGNGPYTSTPDAVVLDQAAFDAAYPSDESVPRCDYLVLPLTQGDLHQAQFGWVRNDTPLERFGYDGRADHFRPLQGGPPQEVGVTGPTSNTDRMAVRPIPLLPLSPSQPVRVFLSSGFELTVQTKTLDADFTVGGPLPGFVEVSLETGRLNFATADLTSFNRQGVRYQGQRYAGDSNHPLGFYGLDTLYLNPLPGTGQYPLVKVEEGVWLTPVEVPDEGSFTVPAAGTFQWARDTGKVNVPSDVDLLGLRVFYDGVLLAAPLSVPSAPLGMVQASRLTSANVPLSLLVPGADLWLRVGSTQLAAVKLVAAFDGTAGQAGVVEVVTSTGQAKLSQVDTNALLGQPATVYSGDLPIERGVALRLFRSPVNLTGGTVKDVTTTYTAENATLAAPLLGTPSVSLPQVPIDDRLYDDPAWLNLLALPPLSDPSTGRLRVEVTQGTGSVTGVQKRLDSPVAPPDANSAGVVLDGASLSLAERKLDVLVTPTTRTGSVTLPDPALVTSSLERETFAGSGTFVPITEGVQYSLDPFSGVVSLITYPGTPLVTDKASASVSGFVLTDTSGVNFLTEGVSSDSLVIVRSPPVVEGVYAVIAVGATTLTLDVSLPPTAPVTYEVRSEPEILRDRVWRPFAPLDPSFQLERYTPLGTVQNAPPLTTDTGNAPRLRFKIGNALTPLVTVKPDDASLTLAGALPSLSVEISQETGHLRFSALDLGFPLAQAVTLRDGADYKVSPDLGFVSLARPFLSGESALVTYRPTLDAPTVTEPVGFQISREAFTAVAPTTTVLFNQAGLPVAPAPPPLTLRGSRPQVEGVTVVTNLANGTVTFLPSAQVTKHFPAGPLEIGETVYITYFVTVAAGGETSFTVLQGTIATQPVTLSQGDVTITFPGDVTLTLAPSVALRVSVSDVYLVQSSAYNGSVTTATLSTPLRQSVTAPPLEVTSGPLSSYFLPDLGFYEALPRGAKEARLVGDRVKSYPQGTLVLWDGEPYHVEGVKRDGGVTVLSLGAATDREYAGVSLARSIRPVLPGGAAVSTQTPLLDGVDLLYRKVPGQVGSLLEGVTVTTSGQVTGLPPLGDSEEQGVAYRGYGSLEAGQSLRASYTVKRVPTASNGYAGQVLVATYTTWSPDSFYFRVEKLSDVRAEAARRQQAEVSASLPSSGPRLSNDPGLTLADRGRASVFYEESVYRNDDVAFRSFLLFTNDLVTLLENARLDAVGVNVGGRDGQLRFNGSLTNPAVVTVSVALNQIDDLYQVSPGPYVVTGPPFVVTPQYTYAPAWTPAPQSRFFKAKRRPFGVASVAALPAQGDVVLDLGVRNLTQVSYVRDRQPWALVTAPAASGAFTVSVDDADGDAYLVRPNFGVGNQVDLLRPDGSVVGGSPYEIASLTPTSLTFTVALTDNVPRGATAVRSLDDLAYYQVGKDLGLDATGGLLTYIVPFPPLDGSVPLVPAALEVLPPNPGQPLSTEVFLSPAATTPDRPPVLDGLDLDDDGEVSFPLQSPTDVCEQNSLGVGRLPDVFARYAALVSVTTPTETFTANLTALNVITRTSGNFGILPLPGQLVRILSGVHAGTAFVRVASATLTAITVDVPYGSLDTGFTAVVGVSLFALTGAGTVIAFGLTLEDAVATFQTNGVLPGYTVVNTVTLERSQVTAVPDETHLTLASPLTLGAINYRVENPLCSFSALTTQSTALDKLREVVATNDLPALPSEIRALERALDLIFTDRAGNPESVTVTLPSTVTGPVWSGVTPGDTVFFREGANRGVYTVASVVGTVITVSGALSLAGSDFVRVVQLEGVSQEGVVTLASLLFEVDDYNSALIALLVQLASFPVLSASYANRLVSSELTPLLAVLAVRDPAAWETRVFSFLRGGERLYDKRFAWIDGRLNKLTGTLARIAQARQRRLQNQASLTNQLIRLLSLSGLGVTSCLSKRSSPTCLEPPLRLPDNKLRTRKPSSPG